MLRTRRLDHQPFVYVWLDATYVHVCEVRDGVSKAIVIATGLRADGHREVLGLDAGDSDNETFRREFLTDLTDRGLGRVNLVTPTPTPAWSSRSAVASKVPPGNAAASTRIAPRQPITDNEP